MSKYRSVYFPDSNPDVWFETRDEADRYDKVEEVLEYVNNNMKNGTTKEIIQNILKKYDLSQRYDWKNPQLEPLDLGD